MHSFLSHSIVLLATLATATAQVTSVTNLVGGAVQTGTSAASLPIGGNIGSGFLRSCSSACGTAHLAVGQTASLTHLDLIWSAGCQATTTGTTVAEATVRYDLWSPLPFTGRLVIAWTPTISGTGSSTLQVDLGANGSIEATGAAVLPVAFGPGTVSLQVHVLCQATAGGMTGPFGSSWSYQGAATGSLSVRLEPAHCQSQTIGTACGITQFAAAGTFLRGVELVGQPPASAEIAVLVLGFAGAALTVPLPPGCLMQVDPAILEWQPIDAGDAAVWTITLGPALLPVTFRAQLFGLDLDTFAAAGSHPLLIDWQ